MPRLILARICALVLGLAVMAAHAEVIIVVSEQSPLDSLTQTQLTDIYLGRPVRLADGNPVVPVDQPEGSRIHSEFYSRYLGRTPAQIKAHWSRLIFTGRGQPPRTLGNDESVTRYVASNPDTIGYIDATFLDNRLRQVRID